MPANVQTMAYYGQKPWHGLGKEVPKGVSAAEMMRAAGLDWEVEIKPARGAKKINTKGQYSRYEVLRLPRHGTKGRKVLLGLVSRRYVPLQNSEAFDFFDPIVRDHKAYFETAGVLKQGERVWVLAKMPGTIEVVRGDDCSKYLLLSNTHDGNGSVIVKFTSIRVVCQNTLMLSLKDGTRSYTVRHSMLMQDKLKNISELLALSQRVFEEADFLFKMMARFEMIGNRMDDYLEAVIPRGHLKNKTDHSPKSWDDIKELYESRKDLQIQGVKGTLWAAYNAITTYEDYKKSREDNRDQRLDRSWFGSGAEIKLRALEKAREFVNLHVS